MIGGRRLRIALSILVFTCAPALAGTLEPGSRELAVEFGIADLDLGSVGPVDLGSADGVRGGVSLGWYKTRVFQIGAQLRLADLEDESGQTIDGSTYGVMLGFHVPTRGVTHPFARIGLSAVGGNLGARYEYVSDLSVGVKFYPSARLGFSVAANFRSFYGEEFVPNGTEQSLTAAFLFKF